MPHSLPDRSAIDPRYKWNAPSVFATDEAWEDELQALHASLDGVRRFQGRLAEGPATLADALDAIESLMARTGRLLVYAGMSYHVDTNNAAAARMQSQARGFYGQMLAATGFFDPELLALGREQLNRWMETEPRLAHLAHYADDLFRKQRHVRSAEVEELLGMVADPFSGVQSTASMLTNADFKFEPASDSQGQEHPLTQSTRPSLLNSPDRETRRTAWRNYAAVYLAHKNSLTNNLATAIRQSIFQMRARQHASTLEMTLFQANIPVEVFHNLIDTFRKHLPTWHRYWRVRRQELHVETLHPYDIWAPLAAQKPDIPYEQAIDWIGESLKPLGDDYAATLRRGALAQRWVDVYPNQGKSVGAFSSGSPGAHPFIMMSYTGDALSLGTLAHELGHSMHSYLSWRTQPMLYSDYSAFVAEVASNFHQALLRAHLLSSDLAPALQIGVIEEALSNFHRYFLIMPTLARFEFEVHQRLARGRGLAPDETINLLADLFAEGYGDEIDFDREEVGIQWATYPHLYMDFYVFQYATGISGAHALANRVLAAEPGAVENYLSFLKAGNSMYPLEALKMAGVDLTSPEPVEETFAVLSSLIDRLEILLDSDAIS